MERKQEILDELTPEGALVERSAWLTPFRTPEGYFEHLPAAVLDTVKAGVFSFDGLTSPLSVPAGYFDGLVQSVLLKIGSEAENELSEIAPLLNTISKQQVYSVPAGYFDQPVGIIQEEKQPAKVVALKGYKRLVQYAAAAVVASVLVGGAFMYTDSNSFIEQEKSERVSSNKSMQGSSFKDVTLNKDEEGAVFGAGQIPANSNTHDFTKKVQFVSDEDLQKYLEENENSVQEPILGDTTEI